MGARTKVTHVLAVSIMLVFLVVTAAIVVLAALGHTAKEDAKEMMQLWAATYSVLVGAVVSFYFGTSTSLRGRGGPNV